MTNEMKDTEMNEVAGGQAINGCYYTYVPDGWEPYQIKYGDCLSVLAMNRGYSVAQLMANNPLIDNANVIRAGFWMVLPRIF